MRFSGFPGAAGRLATALSLTLVLGLATSCKKKPAEEKKADPPPASMQAETMRAAPAMRTAPPAMARVAAMRPAPATPAIAADDPMVKTLTDKLGADKQKVFDSLRKRLKATKSALGGSEKAKIVYGQLLQSVALLEQMGKKIKDRAFHELPGMAATGYVFALMGIWQLKDLAKDLAKRAISAGKKLQIGKARKLASQGTTLAKLGMVLKGLAERYTDTVKALMGSGAETIRVATFAAVVKGYPKISKDLQKTVAPFLKAYLTKEKAAGAKAKMKVLLKSIKVEVQ